jgi:hypothetical protein
MRQLADTLAAVSIPNPASVSLQEWDEARRTNRLDVRKRFAAWVQPRTGGSLQAARELARFL